ncbi:MAG: type III-A CRISPR-associated RAMP protein Csm5, partial [Candidatus Obscuribacterales bacterium]|nr:type III-A CRISPR-associated RAMP protein Csm5 [Candidatus Obscuribacterales bacterium]
AFTHLHIGCGRDVGRWEYFFTADKQQLSFLDYDKLAEEAVVNESLIDELTEAASRDVGGSLQRFLLNYESKDPGLKQRICSSAGLRTLPSLLRDLSPEARSIRRMRLFVGSPKCYIPGSSIKGALRSAYVSNLIENSKYKEEFMPRDSHADDFTNLRMLRERMQKTFRNSSEDTRFFENLIVRDSSAIDSQQMGIASIGLFGSSKKSSQNNDRPKAGNDSDEYAEVMLADTKFQIEISLRTCRSYALPLSGVEQLMQISDHFFRQVWAAERANQQSLKSQGKGVKDTLDFYEGAQTQIPDDCYLLRVGYGTGQMAHSVLLNYRNHYAKEFGQRADHPLRHSSIYARKRPELKARDPYPFTSRSALAGEREQGLPPGWILVSKNLEIQNED